MENINRTKYLFEFMEVMHPLFKGQNNRFEKGGGGYVEWVEWE